MRVLRGSRIHGNERVECITALAARQFTRCQFEVSRSLDSTAICALPAQRAIVTFYPRTEKYRT